MKLIDTHAHLHFSAYDKDQADVFLRLRQAKIGVITVGTSLTNSERAIALAETQENIWAGVALHPSHLTSGIHDELEGEVSEQTLDPERLEQIAQSSKKVVTIGETGLDFHWIEATLDREEAKKKQIEVFGQHLDIADQLDLPVVIHCRDAFPEMHALLFSRRRPVRGVMHSFAGTWEEAQAYLALGFFLGINGIVTFERRKNDPRPDLATIVQNMPLDRLLLETDAPYLAPIPYRGKRNEPIYIESIARRVADIRGVSFDEIAQTTTENAMRLFGLK